MDNKEDGSVFSLPFLHLSVLLCPSVTEGLGSYGVAERCRAGYKVQPSSSSRNELAAWLYTRGSAAKIRWCYTDVASDPACKQTKQLY